MHVPRLQEILHQLLREVLPNLFPRRPSHRRLYPLQRLVKLMLDDKNALPPQQLRACFSRGPHGLFEPSLLGGQDRVRQEVLGSVLLPVERLVRRPPTLHGQPLHEVHPLLGSSRFGAPANQAGQGRHLRDQGPHVGLGFQALLIVLLRLLHLALHFLSRSHVFHPVR